MIIDSNAEKQNSRPSLKKIEKAANRYLKKAISKGKKANYLAKKLRDIGLTKNEAYKYMMRFVETVDKDDNDFLIKAIQDLESHYQNPANKEIVDLVSMEMYLLTGDELKNEAIQPPKYIIFPWLYENALVEIFGPAGVGKTFIVLLITIFSTYEKNFEVGSWKATDNKAGVLYVAGEDSEFILKDRVSKLTADLGESEYPVNFLISTRLNRFGKEGIRLTDQSPPHQRDLILQYLKEHPEFTIVILDNLSSLCPGWDENSKQDWDQINQWLIKLRALGRSVIFVHHAGKDLTKGDRGTTGHTDAMDCVIFLNKRNTTTSEGITETSFEVKYRKNPRYLMPGADISSFTLTFTTEGDKTTWSSDITNKKEDKETKGKRVFVALLLKEYKSQKDIAKAFGVSEALVSKMKKQAIDNGHLNKDGDVTKKGEEWMSENSNPLVLFSEN